MNKPLLHVLFSLLMCLTLPLAATAQVVNIPDPNLRAKIEQALGKASGATITPSDMERLTRLDARNANVSDLTGLEGATSLAELLLGAKVVANEWQNSNAVSDLSPLAGLINLTQLKLRGNNVSDLSPLAGLTNLARVDLRYNYISDLSSLVANTGLGGGDEVLLNDNLLSSVSIKTYVPALQSRGGTVEFDDTTHLNVGRPREVRLIYFLPNDQPYRVDVVQRMKDEIRKVQFFFAEQMGVHGYGNKTFRVETDSQGEPKVHRVDGQYPDNHYVNKDLSERSYLDPVQPIVVDEIASAFNIRANIYVIFIDTDIGKGRGGAGSRLSNGGNVLIFPPVNEESTWQTVAHELGHAFGLLHDFRDGSYLMSYGPGLRDRLAVCHADFLDAHPYFNPDTPIKDLSAPTIKLISPRTYPAGAKRIPIRLQVSDSEGLHQAILYTAPYNGPTILTNDSSVTACFELRGKKETVLEFDYDGMVPFAHNPSYSSNSFVHPIHVDVVDTSGNMTQIDFLLFSEALESLMKISGDNQTSLPNTPLPVPFVVEVWDVNSGHPRRDISVIFTVIASGGTLSVTHTMTDEKGRAESTLTLGPNLGTNIVEVSAAGIEGTVTFTAVTGAPVDIPDPNLRAAIEEARGKAPSTPIAPSDMASLTRLTARGANIANLTGMEFAINLTKLDLGYGEGGTSHAVIDLSPLAGLTQLTSLHLPGKSISDISAVADLTNLTRLNLWGNPISDISPVAGLTNLTDLYLGGGNNISDISPLVANTGLGSGDTVNVQGNPLSYLSIHTYIPALQRRGITVEFDAGRTRPPDVNGDGSVDVLDLIVVTSDFGRTGENIATDVSGDGVVDVLDLVLVAGMFQNTAAAPSTQSQVPETLTAVEVQGWLTDARALEGRDSIMQRGIMVLEQLLVALTPTETELLANYPNPFNPETWIPYRLAEDAFVTLTIYDLSGRVVRTIDVGHRIASAYESRSKAVYWDGRNDVGEPVASGVYFYTLTAGDYSNTRRMLILK